ncbi:MAG: hypothetical protein Q7T05_01805, partial [Dehalococcoidia bacterium]|nr:hypothetical protein [Dehalococcoidia bacterium]
MSEQAARLSGNSAKGVNIPRRGAPAMPVKTGIQASQPRHCEGSPEAIRVPSHTAKAGIQGYEVSGFRIT